MKINNRRKTILAVYGFSFILLLDFIFLFFADRFLKMNDTTLYVICFIIFLLASWRLITLKLFSLEITEHIISVKYGNLFSQLKRPVLEVPLQKVVSLKIDKEIMDRILLISIKSKRGIRNFHYRIGSISNTEAEKFEKIKNIIKASSINEA
ncbi:hypothetical protein J2X97_001744 [Epilithonimonas hungarica]|uniref:hypothetical protein n=1 Tax=Epilithonimonas hungarica TaxID=454006 RepID=UPI0027807E19|nr:hypothetical protein [Epilithonimonas hungarica]MDP9956107.1 hypothetical protein [Epilithonimonas hungarica]